MFHEMVPSQVQGFKSQCKHCGAFDTELRFAQNQECPDAPSQLEQQISVEETEHGRMVYIQGPPSYAQQVSMMQAEWFTNYSIRQLMRSMGIR